MLSIQCVVLSLVWHAQLRDLCEESSMQGIPYDTSHVPIHYDDTVKVKVVSSKTSSNEPLQERREHRAALERDVLQLQKQLIIEMNIRHALYTGFSRPHGSLPRIHADMPDETRNLLLEVAALEEEIVSLEKQVLHLGREIESERMPASDKGTIWESPGHITLPKKAEIAVSPLVSPRVSARINSKASLSSRKSIDQKKYSSLPSLSTRKISDHKSSFITVSVSAPRNSLDNSSSKNSSELRRIPSFESPQKPNIRRSSSFPKQTSRQLFTKKEPLESTGAMHTVPFIPTKFSPPKVEANTPPDSPALVSPPAVGKACSQPPKITTGSRRKPPMAVNARLGKRVLIDTKVASKTGSIEAWDTPRPSAQDKGPWDSSLIPCRSISHDTVLTRRTVFSSTISSEQRMTTKKSASAPNTDNNGRGNMDVPSTVSKNDTGGCKRSHLTPDHAKEVLLSSPRIARRKQNFYKLPYTSKQPPLETDSGTSSQASISTTLSSPSAGKFEEGGANINFSREDTFTGSFRIKRAAA